MEKEFKTITAQFESIHAYMVDQLRKYMSGRKFFEGSEDFPRFNEYIETPEYDEFPPYLPTDEPHYKAIQYIDDSMMRYGRFDTTTHDIAIENISLDCLFYIINMFAGYERWIKRMQ